MSVKVIKFVYGEGGYRCNSPGDNDGDYVLHKDFLGREEVLMGRIYALDMEQVNLGDALRKISKLPYCDSHLAREIASEALDSAGV